MRARPSPKRRRFHQHPLYRRVARLPTSAGVYLMKDAAGTVLYVGKAVNLRARVRSYFNGTDSRRRMRQLMLELVQLEVSLARDEREALLLEAQLIRRYQPKYNIALKDRGRPTCLRIDLSHPFPRLEPATSDDDTGRRFGPFPSRRHAAQMQLMLERNFPLRTCDDAELARQRRPCLQYQLKRCGAPCAGYVSVEQYRGVVDQVIEVLEGGQHRLAARLQDEMASAAERLEFEQAAILRDRLRALEGLEVRRSLLERLRTVPVAGPDRDVIGLARLADEVALSVVPVRWGRQQPVVVYYFAEQLDEDLELLTGFLLQHYAQRGECPPEVVLPREPPHLETLASILGEQTGRPVRLRPSPDLAGLEAVAEAAARAELEGVADEAERAMRAGEALARTLGRPAPVRVLEWLEVDLTRRAAWRTRLAEGAIEAGSSRRMALRAGEAAGPAQAMEAVLTRRTGAASRPDLLVVEGGKAMVAATLEAARQTGWDGVAVVGLPVPADGTLEVARLYLPLRRNPLRLAPHSPVRRLLERLREAGTRFRERDDSTRAEEA